MKLVSQLPENYVYDSHLDVYTFNLDPSTLRGIPQALIYSLIVIVIAGLAGVGWLALTVSVAFPRIYQFVPMQEIVAEEGICLISVTLFGFTVFPRIARFTIFLLLDANPQVCWSLGLQVISKTAFFTRAQYWIVGLLPYLIEVVLAVGLILLNPLLFTIPTMLGGGCAMVMLLPNRMLRLLWTLRRPPGYFFSDSRCDKVDTYSPRVYG